MKKQISINEEVNRINQIIENANKIMEGLYLDDEYTPDVDDTFQPSEHTPQEGEPMEQQPEASPAEKSELVDTIRKMALKGMGDLADDPECEDYQILKKIWQFAEKKPTKPGEGQNQ